MAHVTFTLFADGQVKNAHVTAKPGEVESIGLSKNGQQ